MSSWSPWGRWSHPRKSFPAPLPETRVSNAFRDLAANLSRENYYIVLLGDKNHPEIKGILGHITDESNSEVVANEEEAEKVVTFFKAIFEAIMRKLPPINDRYQNADPKSKRMSA